MNKTQTTKTKQILYPFGILVFEFVIYLRQYLAPMYRGCGVIYCHLMLEVCPKDSFGEIREMPGNYLPAHIPS